MASGDISGQDEKAQDGHSWWVPWETTPACIIHEARVCSETPVVGDCRHDLRTSALNVFAESCASSKTLRHAFEGKRVMSEEKYRLAITVILGVFVVAFIILGIRLTEIGVLRAENGRYSQYDHQRNHIVFGGSMRNQAPTVLDTRTGKRIVAE
jgi:hypothetical protein